MNYQSIIKLIFLFYLIKFLSDEEHIPFNV